MALTLLIEQNTSLKSLNTFGLAGQARYFCRAESEQDLLEAIAFANDKKLSIIVLGGGSNIVLRGDLDALVIQPCLMGKQQSGDRITVAAGENWHSLVRYTINEGLFGLENLSLIPGLVGAAPIQNIGAYGQTLANVFVSLQCIDLVTGELRTFNRDQCQFGYRDSIFKHHLRDQVVITQLELQLNSEFIPMLDYKELADEFAQQDQSNVRAIEVSDAVIKIRTEKLPDPGRQGNVGSFFKNPMVSVKQQQALSTQWPRLPIRQSEEGHYKTSAAWLIDQAGLKGTGVGGAMISPQHGLVMVNTGNATYADVLTLQNEVVDRVQKQFGIELQMEPTVY